MKHYYEYFYGNKVSNYGIQNGKVDYRTFAKAFNHVLNNEVINKVEDFEPVNDNYYDFKTDEYVDVFQWYIVEDTPVVIDLLNEANEIVYYSESFGMYIWGVTHYGTSWDYVLTDIDLREKEV